MAYTKYSLTPANNNAAPPDGAPEGMLPSAVNDTMRDMMAQIRDVGDGIRGGTYTMTAPIITGGTITGVALTGNTFTSPVISGGSINNTPIGATTANTGAFSTLSATGVTTVQAGSVSAPAITTTGDTNTGIFFPAADTIAFTEGGVESMRIDSSGNVGIGNTSPAEKLSVIVDSNSALTSCSLRNLNAGASAAGRLVVGNDISNSAGLIFGSSTNSTFGANTLVLYQNNAAPVTIWTNNTERMRITSAGNVGIGTSSPTQQLDVTATSSATSIIVAQNTTATSGGAQLRAGNPQNLLIMGTDSNAGGLTGTANSSFFYTTSTSPIVFMPNATERMRIDSSGNLLVAKTASATPATVGCELGVSGYGMFTRASDTPLFVNRNTNDGELVSFRQDNTPEGSISVSGTTVSYNGGHLSRWSQLPDGSKDDTILKGTILTNLDDMCVWTKDGEQLPNEQLNKMQVSSIEGDTNVAGVFVNWTRDEDCNSDDMNIAMTGDMIIRIADGVVVQKGDLLMSAGDGTAKPQGDDIVRSKTIAKVTSNYVTCTYADGSYCVPCVLMAC